MSDTTNAPTPDATETKVFTTDDFVVGQVVFFQGYVQAPEDGVEILKVGEKVRIDKRNTDGSFVVYTVDRTDDDSNAIGDSAYPDEIQPTGEASDIPSADEGKAKGKGGKAKGGKGAKAAAAEPAGETQTAPAAEATPKKGRNATKVEKPAKAAAAPKAETKAEPKAEKAPKAEKSPLPAQAETSFRQITDSESVSKLLTETQDAIAAAKSLVEQGERTDYTLGGVLHHIYSEGLHKGVTDEVTGQAFEGKRGFSDFVERYLGVAYRKAMYLISIYTTFRQLNINEAQIAALGWAKAKELVKIAKLQDKDGNNVGLKMLEDDFSELAEFAQNNTRDDLIAKISSEYMDANEDAGGTSGRVKATTFKFALTGEAAESVTSALEDAKGKVDNGDANAAFELVFNEWAMLSADLSLDQVLAAVQNRFGVTLQVVREGSVEAAQGEMFDQTTATEAAE